jgi:hypothetical protein
MQSYTGDGRSLRWSDGTPTVEGWSNGGVAVPTTGGGVQFTVPADTTMRTLTVYVGAQYATGTLRAHLSDGSAVDYVNNFTSAQRSQMDGWYTLTYRAASAGQTLTVTWVNAGGARRNSNVTIQGAALAGAQAQPPSAACPCSLWTAATVPTLADNADPNPVELGIKFRSDVAGYITGVRFYKSAANGGTHVGNLWSANGALLARATFTNESGSGWQQVNFSAPIAIAANTTYVASYHTNVGHYAGDNGFFATTGVDKGVLHMPPDGVNGGNGVFAYGSSSAFPASTYNATNYWVDVVFTPN